MNNRDLISREALQREILRVTLENPDSSYNYAVAVANAISNAPAVDAVEVVHAKWVKVSGNPWDGARCSARGTFYRGSEWGDKYCKVCGARMDGE